MCLVHEGRPRRGRAEDEWRPLEGQAGRFHDRTQGDAANSLDPELVWRLDQTFGLDLKQETYDQDLRDGFPYRHPFVLKPGTTSIRVAVREPESGAAGSLTIRPVMCLE